jgi:hypothetical protein
MIVEAPKLFLIGRKALLKSPEKVQEALRLTPVSGTFVASDEDAKAALGICENVMGLLKPYAVVADFPFDIAAVTDGGAVVPGELPEVPEQV